MERADHPWLERAARVGYVANGVLHLLIGLLALRVAAGDEQERTDTTGALQTLSGLPWGIALIWAGRATPPAPRPPSPPG